MIGLVLVTHGRLAAEFIVAMEHVVGPQDAVAPICIGPDDDMEARRKDIADAIKVVDSEGVRHDATVVGRSPVYDLAILAARARVAAQAH